MGKVVIEPATIDQKRNWFLQISNIHCVRYRWEFSCIQKKDQYISTISHAKDRTTKSRQGHCTHREGQVAVCRVLVITAASEIPVTEAPDHDGKGRKTQGCCSETVHNNVNNDFPGENTLLYLWRSVHNLQCGDLHAQTYVRHTGGYYNNPEDFDWGKQENRLAILIFESQTSKECTHLCDILGEQIQHKFLDVVKNTAAFFHNFKDRGKIIICQNNIRGIFGDIEPAWLIAIPTSTCLSKGESFTPLPVMAANSPRQ